jgi:predicted metal-binding protein
MCSKCRPVWDSMDASTRLIMDRRIHLETPGLLRIAWSTLRKYSAEIPLCCQQELHTKGLWNFRRGTNLEDSDLAVGPPVPIHRSRYLLLRKSLIARLKCPGTLSCLYKILSAANLQMKYFRTHVICIIFLVLVCGNCAQNFSSSFGYTLYFSLKVCSKASIIWTNRGKT